MEINVLIEEGIETEPSAEWMQSVVEKTLLAEEVPPNVEISLVITEQERIRELNREYRGLDRPTDVLSFPLTEQDSAEQEAFIGPPDGLIHLGEVIISYPQAVLQATERGHSLRRELATLIIHGVLHIRGYDDEQPEAEQKMTARTEEILLQVEKESA